MRLSVARRAELLATPAPRDEWLALLARDPEALPSQLPAWTDAVVAVTGGYDTSRLYALPSGVRAVLPAVARPRVDTASRPLFLASQPFGWGAGGLVVPSAELEPADVAAVFADLTGAARVRAGVRPAPRRGAAYLPAAPSAAVRLPFTAHLLDLDGGFGAVWRGFSGAARRAVRKAERAGLTVEQDDTGRLAGTFEELYRLSLRRWAGQQHEPWWLARARARRRDPPGKVAAVARALGASCRIWLARVDGEPAAAVITLRAGPNVVYWRGAMDKPLAGPVRANDLLHRLAIEQAVLDGARTYHWGDSAPGSGLARFKESFGAQPVPYSAFRLERLPLSAADATIRRRAKQVLRFRE